MNQIYDRHLFNSYNSYELRVQITVLKVIKGKKEKEKEKKEGGKEERKEADPERLVSFSKDRQDLNPGTWMPVFILFPLEHVAYL